MATMTTDLFGEIEYDENSEFQNIDLFIDHGTEEQRITITFTNSKTYKDKINQCIDFINQYKLVDSIARKAIVDFFNTNNTLHYYFESNFYNFDKEILLEVFDTTDFSEIEIDSLVTKMQYPDLLFSIKNNALSISVDYHISKEYSKEILCVEMDTSLKIINFSHEN